MRCTGHERYQLQADLQTEKLSPGVRLIKSELHVSIRHASIRQRFSSGSINQHAEKVCAVLLMSLPEIHTKHCQWKNLVVAVDDPWNPEGWFRKGCQEDLRCQSLPEYVLGKKKKKMCAWIGWKYGKQKVALLHDPAPFSVVFPFYASCFFSPHSAAAFSGTGDGRTSESFKQGSHPGWGGVTSEFLCVFQESAGA